MAEGTERVHGGNTIRPSAGTRAGGNGFPCGSVYITTTMASAGTGSGGTAGTGAAGNGFTAGTCSHCIKDNTVL
jgi:hypothetical protein